MKKLVEVYPNVRDLLKVLLDSDVLEARLKSYIKVFEYDCINELESKLEGCRILYSTLPAEVVILNLPKFVDSLSAIESLAYVPSKLLAAVYKLQHTFNEGSKDSLQVDLDLVVKLLSDLISDFVGGVEELTSKIGNDSDVNNYMLKFLSLKGKNLFDDVMVDENGFLVIP